MAFDHVAADRAGAAPPGDEVGERLLDAAAEVFAERGYGGARVAEVARRAGLTTGAIYSRHRGKADLLIDAVDRVMSSELRQVLGAGGPGTATGVLATLGARLVDPQRPDSGLLLEAFVAARHEPELAERLRARLSDDGARLAKLVDEAKTDGLVDRDLSTHALVTFCQALGLGFVLLRAVDTDLPSPDRWVPAVDRVVAAAAPPDPSRCTA